MKLNNLVRLPDRLFPGKINSFADADIYKSFGVIGLGWARHVDELRPGAHLLVGLQPPVGCLDDLPLVDCRRGLVQHSENEVVELLLSGQVGLPPVQLGEKLGLDQRPDRLLRVSLTRVWRLEDDLEVALHLPPVVCSLVRSVVVEDEDGSG